MRRAGGWADRQKNMTELIVAFRNFANAPKKKSIRMQVGHSPCNEMQILAQVQTHALSSMHCYYNPHTRPRASQQASPEMSEAHMSLITLHIYLQPQT